MTYKRIKKKLCCAASEMLPCRPRIENDEKGVSLARAGKCGRMRVCKIHGDRKQCARMASFGLYPGCEFEVLCSRDNAQCLLKIHGSVMSLDSLSAQNIFVEEC